MNKIRALKIYESEYRRIEVSELLIEMKERGKGFRALCRVMGWDRTYFRRYVRPKRYIDLHKNDIENLLLFLEEK